MMLWFILIKNKMEGKGFYFKFVFLVQNGYVKCIKE